MKVVGIYFIIMISEAIKLYRNCFKVIFRALAVSLLLEDISQSTLHVFLNEEKYFWSIRSNILNIARELRCESKVIFFKKGSFRVKQYLLV